MFYHVHVQSKPLLRGFPCCKSLLAVGPLQTPGSMLTLQGIPCEAQLANDVAGNVTFNPLSLFGVALSCFQQVVELFRVKLQAFQETSWAGNDNHQLFHQLHHESHF